MIEKLKASARDIVLAAFAAFVGAFSVSLFAFIEAGDFSVPAIRAFAVGAVVAAGYAAFRKAVAVLATKIAG